MTLKTGIKYNRRKSIGDYFLYASPCGNTIALKSHRTVKSVTFKNLDK